MCKQDFQIGRSMRPVFHNMISNEFRTLDPNESRVAIVLPSSTTGTARLYFWDGEQFRLTENATLATGGKTCDIRQYGRLIQGKLQFAAASAAMTFYELLWPEGPFWPDCEK